MAGAGALEFGLQTVAHQAVDGLVGEFLTEFVAEPLLDLAVAGEAIAMLQLPFERLEDWLRQAALSRRSPRFFEPQQMLESGLLVELEPVRDRIAMDGKVRGGLLARRDLFSLDQHEQVQARFKLGIPLIVEASAEFIEVFGDGGKRLVGHGVLAPKLHHNAQLFQRTGIR